MTTRFFVDGVRVAAERFVVPGTDEGLTVGLNVFETMRTYHGAPFRLEQHLDRLLDSARVVGVPCPAHRVLFEEITGATRELDGVEVTARLMLTMGGRRLLHVAPLDRAKVGRPVRVATRIWEPSPWLDGRIKHGSRAAGEVARRAAGVDELLWVGRDGLLTEGTRSSVFAVVGGVLVTPPVDGRILAGITRGALLEAASEAGIRAAERPLPLAEPMDELYATSTLKELAPVVELDGLVGPGAGPVGARVAEAFAALVRRECA